ncbi:hypothetical protein JCM10908_000344 [Rhodotorula pacifica]|uniref:uncharacterized protein n=1 Tax=Rhodotorula pacifica TaxID=1495444 RepID=UPI003178DA1B
MPKYDAEAVAGPSHANQAAMDSGSEEEDHQPRHDLPDQTPQPAAAAEQPGARRASNKLQGKGVKRSRSSTVDSELPSTKPKRKRNRAALSCAPCKKRKIKCDRKLPCESCIKRGEQASCRWEQPKVEPPPQIFALAVEHEQLKRRVAILEQALARLAPDVFDGLASANAHTTHQHLPEMPLPDPPNMTGSSRASRRKSGKQAKQLAEEEDEEEMLTEEDGDGDEDGEEEDYETDSEVVEDAAHALKGLAAAHPQHPPTHQNHNTRSSSASRAGPSQSHAAATGQRGATPTALHDRRPSGPAGASTGTGGGGGGTLISSLGHVGAGSPLRRSTGSAQAHDPLSSTNTTITTGTGGGRSLALSHTPEPIDEVAARAMASLLPRYSAQAQDPPPAVAKRRRAALEGIYAVLPSRKAETDWMLNNYFTRVDWAWHLHHKPTFLAEYEAYSTLRAQGRQYSMDPLWLAYFALTLALSVKSLEAPVSTPLLSITGQDLDQLPGKYVECAERALECADWLKGKPRFRTVQAIVLFAPYYLFAGNAYAVERHQFYLSNAIRMAQALKLHQLGTDPTKMPSWKEDEEAHTGLPGGASSLKREMALRLLSTLLFVDYTGIRSKTLLPPHLVNSALPGNYNDTDLVPEGIVPPRPEHLATDTSLDIVRHRIALEQYHFKEGLGQTGQVMTYEVVLAADARYQAILDDIPTDLSEAYIPPLGEPLMTLWRRSATVQGIHSRILRLHRPYIAKGRTDETYRFSTERAISAARVILATQVSLSSAPLLRGAFQLVNIQLAVVVLFSTLWQAGDETPREVEEDVAAITSIFGWLERHTSSRVAEVKLVASSSLKAFRMLMHAYEERKARRAAIKSSGWPTLGEEESFGDALRRISTLVAVPDLLAAGPADEAMYITPAAITAQGASNGSNSGGGASGMSLDSLLAPTSASPFGVTPPLGLTPRNGDAAGGGGGAGEGEEFDRTLLEGLEFGDPSFSWSTWTPLGQFATLGTF